MAEEILDTKRPSDVRVVVLIVIIYLFIVGLSSFFLVLKRDALQFHDRDYNYFIEQAARFTDPQMSKRFALNIEGYNFLGLQGIEGVKNLYHAIHAEYFRYTYVLLYAIFQNTLPIFLFYSMVFYSPILYFAFILFSQGNWAKRTSRVALIFTLFYVLFPATQNAVTADLRPRILFIPAWCLLVLAIYYDRPFIEKLIFFILLMGIREDGVLIGIFVIALNFLAGVARTGGNSGGLALPRRTPFSGINSVWKEILILLAIQVATFLAFLAFMNWGGYDRIDTQYDPRNIILSLLSSDMLFLLGGIFLVVILAMFLIGYFDWKKNRSPDKPLKRRQQFIYFLILLVYLGAILMTTVQLARWIPLWLTQVNMERSILHAMPGADTVSAMEIFVEVVTNPLTALPLYMFLLMLVLLEQSSFRKRVASQADLLMTLLYIIAVIAFAITTLATFPHQVIAWQQNIPQAQLVWDFTHRHDRIGANVLLDYDTYQAFYNFENILVYNRLPLWLFGRVDRPTQVEKHYYPQNKDVLIRYIAGENQHKRRMEFAVISQDSLENVLELALLAGVPVRQVDANGRYVVLKFGD